ncbi:hypothetical protein CgunFtcFv8_020163 [Champsocephalus gunnari]|uniref:Uncharacterized protein n=1 Tax=Champsocephalus gunnari TaxID=52237 RepID=A0AAN8HPK3_CHAGU|nr:hypothetical protein CgunFtcFv8_020163 [Champsocephalus gunnari]
MLPRRANEDGPGNDEAKLISPGMRLIDHCCGVSLPAAHRGEAGGLGHHLCQPLTEERQGVWDTISASRSQRRGRGSGTPSLPAAHRGEAGGLGHHLVQMQVLSQVTVHTSSSLRNRVNS